jgi:hypothetical protein
MVMTRAILDSAQWVSLRLVVQQISLTRKRGEEAMRHFVEATLPSGRTAVPASRAGAFQRLEGGGG